MRLVTPNFNFDQNGGPPLDGDGGPPHDGDMEERVKKLEELAEKTVERLTTIERDVAVVASNYLSKNDLSDAMNAQIKWIVGTAVVLGVAALTIMTFVLNNAVPKQPTAPPVPPAPIVIYAQPPAATPVPAQVTVTK